MGTTRALYMHMYAICQSPNKEEKKTNEKNISLRETTEENNLEKRIRAQAPRFSLQFHTHGIQI